VSIRAVIVDCDGVLRHWDAANGRVEAAETAAGLAPGTVLAAAFGPDLGSAAITGRLPYEDWVAAIRTAVGHHEPVDVFAAGLGEVDHAMVDLVRDVRAAGVPVAVLSNATTRFEADLAALGLDRELDVVLNTARLGVAKPDPDVFRLSLSRLGVSPAEVVFTDDHRPNVDAAAAVGITAIHFTGLTTGPAELRANLVTLGVLPP
jgi:putative hydrolase of the HAD superfamily